MIVGGPGRDVIAADRAAGDCRPLWCKLPYGNDLVEARDGEADSISCGAGADRVVPDAADVVAPDCETVERPPIAGGGAAGGGPAPVLSRKPHLSVRAPGRLRTTLRRGLRVDVTGTPGRVITAPEGRARRPWSHSGPDPSLTARSDSPR